MEYLNGWAGRGVADKAFERLEKSFSPFCLEDNGKTEEYLWRYSQRVHGGKNWEPLDQETGDCVSQATKRAGDYLTAVEMCEPQSECAMKFWFAPYIYGVSRTASDCGNGELRRSQGSVGAWAVQAVKNHGVLFEDDPEVPAYSGSLADEWGYRGVPKKFYALASDNPVKSAAPVRSVEELRRALLNKFPVIIGSEWGFEMTTKDNHRIYTPSGKWGHEMVFIGWHDDPFPGAYRQNSWGMKLALDPLQGEPDGGAWSRADDLEREIRSGAELWALSRFEGFKVPGRAFI